MAEKNCTDDKAGTACRNCAKNAPLLFWCEVCEKTVEEKRCPSCGLNTRKVRLGRGTALPYPVGRPFVRHVVVWQILSC